MSSRQTRKHAPTGQIVVFGSWEHMVGSFWVARVKGSRRRWGGECVSGSGGTRGSFRGWRSQDGLIVLIMKKKLVKNNIKEKIKW